MRRAAACLALLLGTPLVQAGDLELRDGETISFTVPGVSTTNGAVSAGGIFFEVPRNVRNARVTLVGDLESRDVNLFLKADTPFSATNSSRTLFAEADFWSISTLNEEFVDLQDFGVPAVQGRTWHVVILGFQGAETRANLSLAFDRSPAPNNSFTVDFDNPTGAEDCDTTPWNDSAPHTPIGGNTATNLGQARRNALTYAAELLSSELTSRVPIRIRACWSDLGPEQNGAITLAGARTNELLFNSPGLPPNTVYSQASGTRLAGTTICRVLGDDACDEQEVFITFNIHARGSFYYGFDPATAGTVGRDFVTVALHEITHGLGFFSLLGEEGAPFRQNGVEFYDAFARRLALLDERGLPVPFDDPSLDDATRAAAVISFDNLLWIDDQANVQAANTLLTFEQGLIRMNAPEDYQPGSSVSHVSGAYCDLMRPSLALCRSEAIRDLGLARRILHGIGWTDARNAPPGTGLFFDRTRVGHGYDLRLGGTDEAGNDIYVLTFYSYRALGGTPEWYQAVGTIRDGAFVGTRNTDGNGMPRFLYDAAASPPQQADPGTFSQVAVPLNGVPISPACTDGVDRRQAESLASFQWAIGRDVGEWCAEPLAGQAAVPPPEFDFGGLWFAGIEDQGWGLTIETIAQASGRLDLFVLAYVYDADGTPVWFFGVAEGFRPGVPITLTMFQRNGYPRTRINGALNDSEAGELTLTLVEPSNALGAGNRASISVNFTGGAGGSWVRDDVAIQRLTAPRRGAP